MNRILWICIGVALLASISPSSVEARPSSDEDFFGIDKAGMEYFELTLHTTGNRRIGPVTFNTRSQALEAPYLGRRYTGGATQFRGELTFKTFRVFRENGPHEDTLFFEVEARGNEWAGNFFDVDGTTTGELVLTQDYSRTAHRITRVCRVGIASSSYYVCESRRPYRNVCHDRTFPGRYSHLSPKSCEAELEDFYCNSKKDRPQWLVERYCEKPGSD